MHTTHINKGVGKARRIASAVAVATMMLAPASLLTSCSDFLEEYSQELARVQSVDDLEELVMGDCILDYSYSSNANSMFSLYNDNYQLLHFLSDELEENITAPFNPGYYSQARKKYFPYFTWQQFGHLDYQNKTSLASSEAWYWDNAYKLINNCNMVIDAANEMNANDNDVRQRLNRVRGEAHYLRATYYLLLANLYGNAYQPDKASETPCVPIKTSSVIEDKEYQRESVAEVYKLINNDLTLSEEYLAKATPATSIYHPSLAAAYIVHSRVALYMQQWSEASRLANLALELNSSLLDMCNWSPTQYPLSSENPEVIFSNGASTFGNRIYSHPQRKNSSYQSYSPEFAVSPNLVALFDDADGRKVGYITNKDDISNHQWSVHKIDNSTANLNQLKTVSDVFAIRTAEAYLNLAEAEAQQGNESKACDLLHQLRSKRISGTEKLSLTGSSLMQFIREERERELCFEGHRWFDLRRYMVDTKYPFQKVIEHTFGEYIVVNYDHMLGTLRYYRLEPSINAYTLSIPFSVREFQSSIGNNARKENLPYKVEVVNEAESF